MKLTCKDSSAAIGSADLLVLFGFEGEKAQLPAGVSLPKAAALDFKGKFRETRLADVSGGSIDRVLLVGLGKRADCDWERLRRATAVGVKRAESMGLASMALWVSEPAVEAGCGAEATGRTLAEAAVMGHYQFDRCKSKPTKRKLERVVLCGPGREFAAGAKRGEVLGQANCFARDLQNAPGNLMTPSNMAEEARKIARASTAITCKVLDEATMAKLGMGALLGVARGSREPAKLIHLVYKPTRRAKGSRKIALVGKGLTFDTGGISLKPGARMDEMKFDMSGGAAVLGVFHALAQLGCEHEVHGIVPSTENMPDGQATKPGDVHTAMDGTTIEVLNTDAEGRLILCDALAYAKAKVKPDTILDLATLTGAVVVGLGHEVTGIFPSTHNLRDALHKAGEATAERVWPLPLLDTHKEQMKSQVADLKNISSPSMGAGSSAGAAFLAHFVGDTEWCHLDIAGTAWGGVERDYVGGSSGSGVGVRLLLEYLHQG
ncbi:MAG: leucyl aminopeptidase [Planctomycetaceae bacterium]|nr:leucyl aminopeptidase [Planctomycetaceae bacterium]